MIFLFGLTVPSPWGGNDFKSVFSLSVLVSSLFAETDLLADLELLGDPEDLFLDLE